MFLPPEQICFRQSVGVGADDVVDEDWGEFYKVEMRQKCVHTHTHTHTRTHTHTLTHTHTHTCTSVVLNAWDWRENSAERERESDWDCESETESERERRKFFPPLSLSLSRCFSLATGVGASSAIKRFAVTQTSIIPRLFREQLSVLSPFFGNKPTGTTWLETNTI